MANTRKTNSFWIIVFPNILLLYASLYIAFLLRYQGQVERTSFGAHIWAFTPIFLVWMLVFFIHGLFDVKTLRRYSSLIFNLLSATLVSLLAAVIYFYFQPTLILTPRRFLLIQVGVAFLLLLAWYLLIKYLVKNKFIEGVYLFSFNNELAELESEIKYHDYLGFKILGHLNANSLGEIKPDKNTSIVLPDNLNTNQAVLLTFYTLRKLGVNFYNYKDFYEQLLRRVYLSQLSEVWFLENITYKEKRLYNFIKRVIDIAAGIAAGAVFVVTFPLCALLIKLTSPGPILFIQERVGKDGHPFRVYKYRTMSGGPTNTWTQVNDPRITKVGKFMRTTRLDELPQFINLLVGNMSLVGPRPEQKHIVEQLIKDIPFYDERHVVKPGLTGWAQLNIYAGSVEETKLKLQYDLYYIKHRSLLFDLEIIFKTIYAIFTWQGR